MSITIVRLTHFQVERLQCIGGQRRATPYRITTFHASEIGGFGKVMEAATEAGNAAIFEKTGIKVLKHLFTALRH